MYMIQVVVKDKDGMIRTYSEFGDDDRGDYISIDRNFEEVKSFIGRHLKEPSVKSIEINRVEIT